MFGASLAVWASACGLLPSQAAPKMPRIGYLQQGPREVYAPQVDAFVDGLRDLGYVENETVKIEWRFAPSSSSDAPWSQLVTDLVALPVDIIVANTTPAAIAAKQVTSAIPIVAANIASPVETGLVASYARPGGNVTALPTNAPGLEAKHFDLLLAVVPGLTATVDIVDTTLGPSGVARWVEFSAAAESAGVDAQRVDVSSAEEFESAFSLPVIQRAQAMNINAASLGEPIRERIAQLALQYDLAAIATGNYAEKGLLMGHGANVPAIARRAAVFVDKILKGTRPADLPVELPSVFDLAVNLRTAQALGLTIPPDVAAQVNQWIQ
jgi:putative ABC transport system substrate-binding protein